MDEPPVLKEDRQDRALCALQVAAVSGFAGDCRNIQTSCLFLCNVCRNGVPVPKLTISEGVPASILAELPPGTSRLESQARSRVLSYRRVLKAQWTVPKKDSSTSCFQSFRVDKDIDMSEVKWPEGMAEQWTVPKKDISTSCFQSFQVDKHIDMTEVKWPEGTAEIVLLRYYGSIEGIAWPASLVRLAFCISDTSSNDWDIRFGQQIFNQPLDGVTFPAGLRELFLGNSFNQPIDNATFPEGLVRLSMPGFNYSMQNVHWPVGLKTLELLDPSDIYWRNKNDGGQKSGIFGFNQPLEATLPSTLETLWLSDGFNQAVDDVVWPTNLVKVGFGSGFCGDSLSGIVLPSTLRVLLVYRYNDLLARYGELPEKCEVITLEDENFLDLADEDDGEVEEYMIDVEQFGDQYDNDYVSDGVIDDDGVDNDFVL